MQKYLWVLFTALLATAAYAVSPPFPGGVLLVRFDPGAEASCAEDGVYSYPRTTVQYWYGNAGKLFRIRTDGTAIRVDQLRMDRYRGYGDIYKAAAAAEDHEFGCSYLVWFNPADARSFDTALRAEKLFVGGLMRTDGIWYWGRRQ
ncbi:MAG: hypothetical protein JWQ01_2363 [Massilia sp.]|jgi:hypothetical protein|nr:hypothetical protein [Massilia sp.]